MFGKLTYLIWHIVFLYSIILFLWLRWRTLFWRRRRAFAWAVLGSLIGGWAWDALAVQLDLWHYDPNHIIGWWLIGLPIEEWLWIVGVTLMFGMVAVVFIERGKTMNSDQ
jgi:lycopene cyclase domain-containing protein